MSLETKKISTVSTQPCLSPSVCGSHRAETDLKQLKLYRDRLQWFSDNLGSRSNTSLVIPHFMYKPNFFRQHISMTVLILFQGVVRTGH